VHSVAAAGRDCESATLVLLASRAVKQVVLRAGRSNGLLASVMLWSQGLGWGCSWGAHQSPEMWAKKRKKHA
jgi:hypothetical protein